MVLCPTTCFHWGCGTDRKTLCSDPMQCKTDHFTKIQIFVVCYLKTKSLVCQVRSISSEVRKDPQRGSGAYSETVGIFWDMPQVQARLYPGLTPLGARRNKIRVLQPSQALQMAAEQHRRQSPVQQRPQPCLSWETSDVFHWIPLQGWRAKRVNSVIQTVWEGPMLEFNTLHLGKAKNNAVEGSEP